MNQKVLSDIFTLRLCIGYLGEADQHAWWPSAFLAPTSAAFLAPVFGKTRLQAQYHGVCAAAAKVHDEHIGIGRGVFHLFRLPEAHEIDLQRGFDSQDNRSTVADLFKTKDSAAQFLSEYSRDAVDPAVGPVHVGTIAQLSAPQTWAAVAGRYARAFKDGAAVFPYFTRS